MASFAQPPSPATLAALTLLLVAARAEAAHEAVRPTDRLLPVGASTEASGLPLSAIFYSDTSCLLTIGDLPRVGRTLIDANLGGDDAPRMLIHCDTDDGRRLTLLARGEPLEPNERMDLLPRELIESGEGGVIAWLTRVGTTFADESVPRRYVMQGHVMVRELPAVQVDGMAANVEHSAFAQVDGLLEAQPQPGGGPAPASPNSSVAD